MDKKTDTALCRFFLWHLLFAGIFYISNISSFYKEILMSIEAVGLVLVHRSSRTVLVLREKKAKPSIYKEEGMESFPLETMKEGENKWEALSRMWEEEMGMRRPGFETRILRTFNLIPGRSDIETTIFVAWCEELFDFSPSDTDVEFSGWRSFDALLSKDAFVRVEVQPVLRAILDSSEMIEFLGI